MADDTLGGFLSGLQSKLVETAQSKDAVTVQKTDDQHVRFSMPAPNAIEWAVRPEYLDTPSIYHHSRQYQIIRDFFQLRCPLSSCNDQSEEAKDCFGKTEDELKSERLLMYSDEHGEDVCPNCGSKRSELVADGLLKLYSQLHGISGMRSGKSSLAAVIGTYIEHRIITLGHRYDGKLYKIFNQLPNQAFEMTFIASTDVQSADTIWAKYVGLRANSPWFKDYIKYVKQLEVKQNTPDGAKPWTYEERDRYITNGYLSLKINSLNSNSGGLAGRTRVAAFIDELARFENTDSARSADEAYRVLENSLRTVRSFSSALPASPWLGTMVSISSPMSEDDKAMRLLKQAPTVKGMYHFHYATWEFNPDLPRSEFDDDFEKDPIGAARDFGAQPPSAASPLIVDPMRFRELAIQSDLKPTAEFRKIIHVDRTGREYISANVENAQLVRNGERYVAFDAGSSFDSFAGACAHGEWVVTPEGRQLVTVFDWVIRLVPENKPRRDIWFDFVVTAIDHLSKYANISRIEFDRWQSTYLIQQLRSRGIMCEMKGTTAEYFVKFINDVSYSKVRMLPPMPNDFNLEPPMMSSQGLAFYELEHLERSGDLKKVFNPKKGMRRGYESDDTATVCAHVSHMVQSSVVDISNSNSRVARMRREQAGNYANEGGGQLARSHSGSKRGW